MAGKSSPKPNPLTKADVKKPKALWKIASISIPAVRIIIEATATSLSFPLSTIFPPNNRENIIPTASKIKKAPALSMLFSLPYIALKEKIACAAVLITGGIRKADVVVVPLEEKPKIVGDFRNFEGPGETLGVGTIYCDENGPKLHIHAAMAKSSCSN